MSEKHTPGPWHVAKPYQPEKGDPLRIEDETCFSIATLDYTNGPEEADARLIAAAPDLLAAAEGIVQMETAIRQRLEAAGMTGVRERLGALHSAIAKATGGDHA